MTPVAIDPRLELVQRAYALLETDDIGAFLQLFASDATVDYPAVGQLPYGGVWKGIDAIARFLERHDEAEEILDFNPVSMAVAGESVFVRGFFRGRSKLSGRTWETKWVHIFGVDAGRLQQWEAYFDTAAALGAHRP